ncbi:MAG: DUF4390 domain-containing protein [Nitrospirota bacterium]
MNSDFDFKSYKFRFSLFTLFLAIFCTLFSYSLSSGTEISGLVVKLESNEIYVTASLSLENKHIQELENGVAKEFRFYIDLFRIWQMWPDEFVLGKSFEKTLKCDPVKKEYIATSYDGVTLREKRFKSFESMMKWATTINDLKLTSVREIEPGEYFVRVTIESKIRKLPPVIGYFIIFLSENEFKISKDSSYFFIGTGR